MLRVPPALVILSLGLSLLLACCGTMEESAADSQADVVVAPQEAGEGTDLLALSSLASTGKAVEPGVEFRVNTITSGTQDYANMAMADNGDFVVVWQGEEVYMYEVFDIRAQRYLADGTPQGSEFRVNTTTDNNQTFPAVAMAADTGAFVVVWESEGQDGSSTGVYGQRYDADGVAQGDEFLVNTTTSGDQQTAAVAMAADGSFVVAWESYGQDGDLWGVYAQRYDADGETLGSEFQVNTTTTDDQRCPGVGIAEDGSFVLVWSSYATNGNGWGVFAQRYDDTGAASGSEFQVNTYNDSTQFDSVVGMAADGGFVVAWVSWVQDGDSYGIYAQRYDADGVAQGGEFRVNSYSTSRQVGPDVGMAADGAFVISWHSDQDGSFLGIYAQRYNADGEAEGDEFQVNTYTSDAQAYPTVRANRQGLFAVAWDSECQDQSLVGVYAKRFDCVTEEQCSDGLWCNGTEVGCVDGVCVHGVAPECPDDGLFCTGTEGCDEENDACASSGDPCNPDTEVCNEDTDTCDEIVDDDTVDDDTADDDTVDDDTTDDDTADDDTVDDDTADDDTTDDDTIDDDTTDDDATDDDTIDDDADDDDATDDDADDDAPSGDDDDDDDGCCGC